MEERKTVSHEGGREGRFEMLFTHNAKGWNATRHLQLEKKQPLVCEPIRPGRSGKLNFHAGALPCELTTEFCVSQFKIRQHVENSTGVSTWYYANLKKGLLRRKEINSPICSVFFFPSLPLL